MEHIVTTTTTTATATRQSCAERRRDASVRACARSQFPFNNKPDCYIICIVLPECQCCEARQYASMWLINTYMCSYVCVSVVVVLLYVWNMPSVSPTKRLIRLDVCMAAATMAARCHKAQQASEREHTHAHEHRSPFRIYSTQTKSVVSPTYVWVGACANFHIISKM